MTADDEDEDIRVLKLERHLLRGRLYAFNSKMQARNARERIREITESLKAKRAARKAQTWQEAVPA